MTEKVFTSYLNLTMQNKQVESDYQEMKNKKLKFVHLPIVLFSFLASLGVMIFQYFFLHKFQDVLFYKFNVIMCSITSLMYLVLMVWSYMTTSIKIIKLIDYTIFYFQIFVIMAFRFSIIRVTESTLILLFFQYLLEIIVRIIWVVLFIHSFKECFYLNTLSLITVWIIIPSLFPEKSYNEEIINTLAYSFVIFSIIIIAFVLERQQKEAFYFHWQADNKAKWLINIFENLNSGFVSIKDNKISYINSYFKKVLQNLEITDQIKKNNNKQLNPFLTEFNLFRENEVKKLTTERKDCVTLAFNQNYEKYEHENLIFHLQYLISQIKYDSQDSSIIKILKEFNSNYEVSIEKLTEENSNQYFSKLGHYLSKIYGIQNFQCLGDISILIDEQEYNFEVHCRVEGGSQIEFLFNDVSRIKAREKQLAEFRYKSLFLSKIAHEFKNPLICITEIINQSFDELTPNAKNNNNLIANLHQIKSLSNFLQILIKDLNYFSESQYGRTTDYEQKETDLNAIVEFCIKIGQSLLIKCNKNKKIELKVNIDSRLPEKIITDEWRLKQVLVNLISNSVKFTLSGSITLNISLEENETISKYNTNPKIKFLVKDTGVGIKEYKHKNIFKPFQKDSTSNFKLYNEFGAGLGLSIANEIATKFGHGIEFKSNQAEGTSFWFYLPLPKEYIRETITMHDEMVNINEVKEAPCSVPYSIISKSKIDSSISENSNLEFDSEISSSNMCSEIKETNSSMFSKKSCQRNTSQISTRKISSRKLVMPPKSLFYKKNPFEVNNKNLNLNFSSSAMSQNNAYIKNCNINFFNTETKLPKVTSDNNIPINNSINIIVADDEIFTRLSTVRILKSISKSLGKNFNILEAEDGLETINLVYKAFCTGSKISVIFSDQSMNFMDGIRSSNIIKEIINRKQLQDIPYYLITAYEGSLFDKISETYVTKIMNKPISRGDLISIIENIIGT